MSAYHNSYVASVLINNTAQREFTVNGTRTVTVPFGAEYKIRLKNKSKNRAIAHIKIDGHHIDPVQRGIIVDQGKAVDIERFLGDDKEGRKFKFVSKEDGMKVGEISDPDSHELGVISVEFFEEKSSLFTLLGQLGRSSLGGCGCGSSGHHYFHSNSPVWPTHTQYGTYSVSNSAAFDGPSGGSIGMARGSTNSALDGNSVTSCATNSINATITTAHTPDLQTKQGATVQGETSKQEFKDGAAFEVNPWPAATILIKLQGIENTVFTKPALFTKSKHVNTETQVNKETAGLVLFIKASEGNVTSIVMQGKSLNMGKVRDLVLSDSRVKFKLGNLSVDTDDYKITVC